MQLRLITSLGAAATFSPPSSRTRAGSRRCSAGLAVVASPPTSRLDQRQRRREWRPALPIAAAAAAAAAASGGHEHAMSLTTTAAAATATAAATVASVTAEADGGVRVRASFVSTATIGLGTATTNGPYEKNEDAAVVARLWPATAAGMAPLSVTAAIAGCGLKNTDPGSGNAPPRSAHHHHHQQEHQQQHQEEGAGAAADDYHIAVGGLEDDAAEASAAAAQGGAEQEQQAAGGGHAVGPAAAAAAAAAHLAAVLDGHGGRGTAKWASRRLPRLVAEHLARGGHVGGGHGSRPSAAASAASAAAGQPAGAATAAVLAGALRSFDRWWADAMHDPDISRHGHDDSGSTAALALVSPAPGGGWRVAVANLGDSKALLVRADAGVEALSDVHNTGNASELERLVAAGAQLVHPQLSGADDDDSGRGAGAGAGLPPSSLADGHARFFPKGPIWGKRGLKVSRALGDAHFKRPQALVSSEPSTRDVSLPPGGPHRLLLLVTDGVTDVLSDAEIASTALAALSRPQELRSSSLPPHDDDARAAARAVVAAAAAHRCAHDNMTCAAVVFA